MPNAVVHKTAAKQTKKPAQRCQQIWQSPSAEQFGHANDDPNPNRDAALSFFWDVDFEQYSKKFGLSNSLSARERKVVASLIAAGIAVASEGRNRRISYSRSHSFYSHFSRYVGTAYTYDTVLNGVDLLVAVGVFTSHQKQVPGARSLGTQSSFLPSTALAFEPMPTRRKRDEVVLLKDGDKHLISYTNTERTDRDRRTLQNINEFVDGAQLKFRPQSGELLPNGIVKMNNGTTLNLAQRQLFSVYNNSSWHQGGRMYGAWYQQISSTERANILIDGKAVVEEDFQHMHPRLLYRARGICLDRDAYSLPGYCKEMRRQIKLAFNIMLNASSHQQAVWAIVSNCDLSRDESIKLINAIKAYHPDLEDYFESGVGLRLQTVDSKIAKRVITRMMSQYGVVVLPIHDSFIVITTYQGELLEMMEASFEIETRSIHKLLARS